MRLRASIINEKIADVQISGDFFLVPSEALPKLENFLTGWEINAVGGAMQLESRLQKFIGRERMQLIGVDANTIAQSAYEIIEQARTDVKE